MVHAIYRVGDDDDDDDDGRAYKGWWVAEAERKERIYPPSRRNSAPPTVRFAECQTQGRLRVPKGQSSGGSFSGGVLRNGRGAPRANGCLPIVTSVFCGIFRVCGRNRIGQFTALKAIKT